LHLFRIAALGALLTAAGVPAATIAAAPAGAATSTYTITDLGSLGGGVTDATAINASGQVTGYSYLFKKGASVCPNLSFGPGCEPYHAFLWTNGKMADLGTLSHGLVSLGAAINDSAQVVGFAADRAEDFHAALLTGKPITTLPGLGTDANAINDSGQILGGEGAAIVDDDGTFTVLPNPPNFDVCSAVAINNNGQVLGPCAQSGPFGLVQSAVVWTNDTPTVLPTLGGPDVTPTAINNNGQVVGTAQTSTGATDGFLVSNGTITDLGPTFSPAAINDNGVIVGGDQIDNGGTVQNLNTLIPAGSGYQIQSATGINDNGQIIANAEDTATGQQHALLLTPN
jgi:probable HAF family extracellular repeat protein